MNIEENAELYDELSKGEEKEEENLPERTLEESLELIIRNQVKIGEYAKEAASKSGCLFWLVIASIVVNVIAVLLF
jgi:hypothetical protein